MFLYVQGQDNTIRSILQYIKVLEVNMEKFFQFGCYAVDLLKYELNVPWILIKLAIMDF
jgi:hypothetical protein